MKSGRARTFAVGLLFVCGCQNGEWGATESGAALGTALGAGLGAIVGHEVGDTGAGIAIGAASGLIGGGLIGRQADAQNTRLENRDRSISDQQAQIEENKRIIDQLRSRGADVRDSERGVVVNLPDVLFEFNKADLRGDAQRTVKDIADVLQGIDGRDLYIEGHTDAVGTIPYNQRLSEERARSVAHALVESGVERHTIYTRGYGESDPIASNKTAAGRQRNRRVEVVIANR